MKNYFFLLIFIGSMNLCRADIYEDYLSLLEILYIETRYNGKKLEDILVKRWQSDSYSDSDGYFRLLEHYLPVLIEPRDKFPKDFRTLAVITPAYLDYATARPKDVSIENRLAAAFLLTDQNKFRSFYETAPTDSIAKKYLGAWAFIKYEDPLYKPAWETLLKNNRAFALRGILLLSNATVLNKKGKTMLRDEFQRTPDLIDALSFDEKYMLLPILVYDHVTRFPGKLTIEDFRSDPLSGILFSHLEKYLNGVTISLWTEKGKLSETSMYSRRLDSSEPLKIEVSKKEDWKN